MSIFCVLDYLRAEMTREWHMLPNGSGEMMTQQLRALASEGPEFGFQHQSQVVHNHVNHQWKGPEALESSWRPAHRDIRQ